jgi:hypothetical protein
MSLAPCTRSLRAVEPAASAGLHALANALCGLISLPAPRIGVPARNHKRRHGTGLQTDADVLAAIPGHDAADLFWIRDALAKPQPPTGIVDDTDRRGFL